MPNIDQPHPLYAAVYTPGTLVATELMKYILNSALQLSSPVAFGP